MWSVGTPTARSLRMRFRLPLFVLSAATVATATACAVEATDETQIDEARVQSLESVPASEAADIQRITQLLTDAVEAEHREQPAGSRVAHRDAHHKHHGCVKARFDVETWLPPELRSSVFKQGASYPAWVRFSNGSGKSLDDKENDARGMAIKLIGVPGDKLLGGEAKTAVTQDFLLINHDVFFVSNVADYVAFQEAVTETGSPLRYFFPSLNPFKAKVREALIAREITGKKIDSPLHTSYFSMAPILFRDRAVKLAAIACEEHAAPWTLPTSPNYLREAMRDRLRHTGVCFDIGIQERTAPTSMPVEDPTVRWDQRDSEFVVVGRLQIDPQDFSSEAQMKYCEDLSFTPWHAAPEHRPLGGLNRARRTVYETIAKVRRDLNGAVQVEPTDLSVPGE